jgi:chromosome segregation ATPase
MPHMTLAFIPGLGDAPSGALVAFLVTAGIAALIQKSKLAALTAATNEAQEKLKTEAEAALLAEKARATAAISDLQNKLDTTSAKLADVEQRYATHREVADRRLNDASQQIARLESDLAATREVAAQLPPTQARIKDLETALAAEHGRFAALEKAVEAHNSRAADLEKRLAEAQAFGLKVKEETDAKELEIRRLKAEAEALAADGGMENEVKKAHEATRVAEAKIAQLQKNLSASQARLAMVQKEFMSAVGTAPAAASASVSASPDKRVRDLEEKIAAMEAESRKKTREDGYKIAELEYRLSEALEKAAGVSSAPLPAAPEPTEPPAS